MKFKIILLAFLFVSSLFADTTMCYKKSWKKLSTIEVTPLDGGKCNSELSLKQMKENGWRVSEIKVTPSKNGIDYLYILSNTPIEKMEVAKVVEDKLPEYSNEYYRIEDTSKNEAKIQRGNLKIGQSGIIIHKYENNLLTINANAKVIDSNNNFSIIEFEKFDDLKQDAIPTTKLKPQDGDIFALNYMYNNAILISPNADNYKSLSTKFTKFNFIHLDIFATYLKINKVPLPSKKIIQKFAKEQNLGTLFFFIENYLYIVDSKTFTILDKVFIFEKNTEQTLPFYTRVEEIEKNFWDIDFKSLIPFSNTEKEKTYNNYYKHLLGIEI